MWLDSALVLSAVNKECSLQQELDTSGIICCSRLLWEGCCNCGGTAHFKQLLYWIFFSERALQFSKWLHHNFAAATTVKRRRGDYGTLSALASYEQH